ncbi:PAS domain-containing protein [Brevundimonas denitrificans]|uniref:PAS domain-containing protein n=1 Tax=Brevundimonas denitrificans TaxID=1443434 RepID=UPI00223BA218|nr:PAS domain-containing protein [Brevundimonas denitrificans]
MTSATATPGGYTLPPELIAVLDASPDFQILLAPDQTVLFANVAFKATTPDEVGPLIGRPFADSLLGRDARRAASRRIILDAVRQALANREVIRPPIFRYDIQKDSRLPAQEAWWRLCASPCVLDGRPCLLLTASEVTAAISMGRTGDTDIAEEAGPGGALVWAERRRLGQMFDQAADMMALVVGPDHVFEMINPAMKRRRRRAAARPLPARRRAVGSGSRDPAAPGRDAGHRPAVHRPRPAIPYDRRG